MSRTFHQGRRSNRRDYQIRIRGVRRQPADLRRLARVLIEFARAEAEAEAQASHVATDEKPVRPPRSTPTRPTPKRAKHKREDAA